MHRDDFDPETELLFDEIDGLGRVYALERLFWIELWRVPVLEAVDECGIESRHYGPIRIFANPGAPALAMFNLLLGADRSTAVAGGHLDEALEWAESLGVDCRVPIRRGARFGESEAAEDRLNHRGYRRTGTLATFTRGLGPPSFPFPDGIEVEEQIDESEAEGFNFLFEAGYDLGREGHSFFMGLPGRRDWRAYLASDETGLLCSAATMMHYEMPQLAFAATGPELRGRGAHMAILHRSIEDIRAASKNEAYFGPQGIFAITEESPECPEELSAGARNLLRAGFRLADVRTVWQPPEELVADDG